MKANKIGLVNNNGDYELVNTDLFPYDEESNEECKNNLICDDLLGVLKVHKFLLDHDYSILPRDDFDGLFRKIEALNIIKNKEVDTEMLFEHWKVNYEETFEMYNYLNDEKPLTKKEYKLLKEVLL
jgi:hypothetical protein